MISSAQLDVVTGNQCAIGSEPLVGLGQFTLNLILSKNLGLRLEDRKSTRLNSSHYQQSRMPSSA